MGMNRAGLKRVVKTVRGKRGVVKRTYWVRAKDAAKRAGSLLNRHKGKIALGAAALGLAALNRHKIAGAVRGARLGLNIAKHAEGGPGTLRQRIGLAVGGAKVGYAANRRLDKTAHKIAVVGGRKMANAGRALSRVGAAMSSSRVAGAVRGVGFVHNAIKHSGEKVSLRARARATVLGAKAGWVSNRSR